MSLGDLSSRDAVLSAMRKHDALGAAAFLKRYSFGPAKHYVLFQDGRTYDSKAIAGVAYGYQFPELGPLQAGDFSGGYSTVMKQLAALGFDVRAEVDLPGVLQSSLEEGTTQSADQSGAPLLEIGATYRRSDLHAQFALTGPAGAGDRRTT